MGCAGSTPLPVDTEALRAHIVQLSALTKMPHIVLKTFPTYSKANSDSWPDLLVMEVNGVDAEKIGPELLKVVQGFFPEAAASDMAKVRLMAKVGPPYQQDYRFQWKTRGAYKEWAVGSLVSRREVNQSVALDRY